MNKILSLVALGLMLSLGAAHAQDKAATSQQNKMATCQKEAGDKGLKSKERQAFVNKCLADGRKAQQEKMKACNKDAGDKKLKGPDRKAFMKECLSAKA
ncbi:MAG: phosphate starvation-inducible protein PsiF [Ramlibacter sp.]|jgi:hypothetical protein|nr:phosphate starvation-inducible protein PsiF [Ramlibacter sp.]